MLSESLSGRPWDAARDAALGGGLSHGQPRTDLRLVASDGPDRGNGRCSFTGSVLRLMPPMRGQPFQAGRRVFACLGLVPEQLVGLSQHQRVRAAELPDLVFDWQLGGADLGLNMLAAGLGEWPLQRALAAVGEEVTE